MQQLKRFSKYITLLLIMIMVFTLVVGTITDKPSIHDASYYELIEIDHVGPVLSSRVMEYIKSNPECDIDDLLAINGIGKKILRNIRRKYK